MPEDDWSDYDPRPLRNAAALGCVMLALTFAAGMFTGILVIWLYQELGFRS